VPLCIDPERLAAWERRRRADAPPRASRRADRGPDVVRGARQGPRRAARRVARPCCARVPAAELWIVGGGDDARALAAKARGLGVGDACASSAASPTPSSARSTSAHRCSRCRAARRASARLRRGDVVGAPCIGSTADAAGQVIAAGETGELVPYGDAAALGRALAGLLCGRAAPRAMASAGRRRPRRISDTRAFRADCSLRSSSRRSPAPRLAAPCRIPLPIPRTRMPDYTQRPLSFKIRKALRYTRLYGIRRTLSIVRGQYNMKRTYATLPAIPRARRAKHVGVIGCGIFGFGSSATSSQEHGKVIRGVSTQREPRGVLLPALRARLLHHRSGRAVRGSEDRLDLHRVEPQLPHRLRRARTRARYRGCTSRSPTSSPRSSCAGCVRP
jgi:hypothetical protein